MGPAANRSTAEGQGHSKQARNVAVGGGSSNMRIYRRMCLCLFRLLPRGGSRAQIKDSGAHSRQWPRKAERGTRQPHVHTAVEHHAIHHLIAPRWCRGSEDKGAGGRKEGKREECRENHSQKCQPQVAKKMKGIKEKNAPRRYWHSDARAP